MSFNSDCATLIQRYAIYNKDRILTLDEILAQPHYKCVWAWWQALAHYQIDHNYKQLEDAPDGISVIMVMGKTYKMYRWRNSQYEFIQETTLDECKRLYGG